MKQASTVTQANDKRRGQGEDSIYWDSSKNRYVGAVSLGFSPAGTRIRRKVTGRTKAEVRDKLRELHQEVESGWRVLPCGGVVVLSGVPGTGC